MHPSDAQGYPDLWGLELTASSIARIYYSFPPWTRTVDVQAEVLSEVITPFEKQWGYQAAVWCAFFSTRMEGEWEADPNNPQPNNPEYGDWYLTIVCPWDLNNCGNEQLGLRGASVTG